MALSVALSLFPLTGYAELYFAPEMVSSDPNNVADLSRFEKSGAQLPGDYLVDVYVNNTFVINRNVQFTDAGEGTKTPGQQGDSPESTAETEPASASTDGSPSSMARHDKTGLMACLTGKELEALGVNVKAFPELVSVPAAQCIAPEKYIPGAYTAFNFENMRLDISIPQVAMQNSARGYIPPERWDEGINAALLNYRFNSSNANSHYGTNNSRYLDISSGLNVGPWRLRDSRNWNQYSSASRSASRWQHVSTYAERTIIPLRSELTMGDATTGGDVFDSLGFRGIQMATDDSMYSDSQRGFAPVVRGTANTNARVSIRQNGYLVYETFVAPGAFAIDDLYPVYSSGDLDVAVTEADGGVHTFTVPYSSVPVLQREGHLKYGLTAGKFQGGSDRYGSPKFAQGTFIWGLPHNVTVYGGSQVAENYVSGLLGSGLNLGSLGAISADITQASSVLADGSHHQGQSVRFLYARSLNSLGTTFQVTGYRYSTQGFHTLDETALKGMKGWLYGEDTTDAEGRPVKRPYTDYYNLFNTKRAKLQASVSQRLGYLGSVYLSGVRQTYWNTTGSSDSLQAGFSSSWKSLNYSLSYSYSRDSNRPGADRTAYLSLSVPLDALLPGDSTKRHSMYATYGAVKNSDGTLSQQAGLNGTALEGNNLNWNVSQGYSHGNGNSGSLGATYQGGYGNSNVGYSYGSDYRQINYGVSGGAILHSEGLTLGQPGGETSVLIAAPGVPGAAVENETGVRTDARGYAIKPYAAVYRENRVSLDTNTLDDRTDIDNTVSKVIPTRGAVVRAEFKGRTGSRVLMTLMHNGTPLPFGTTVSVGEQGGIVGDEGQVYLSGMSDSGTLNAVWGTDMQCTADYRLPANSDMESIVRILVECH